MWLMCTNSLALGVVLGESIAKIICFVRVLNTLSILFKCAHVNRVMSKMKLVGVSVRPSVSVATPFGILSFLRKVVIEGMACQLPSSLPSITTFLNLFRIFSLQTSYCCGIFTGTPRKGDRKAKFELSHLLLPKKRQKISRKCLYEKINPTKPRCSKSQ